MSAVTSERQESSSESSAPASIQLSNEDRLRLVAGEATKGKVIADLNFMRLQMTVVSQQIKEGERTLLDLNKRQQELMRELSMKYGVPDIQNYSIDYDTGVCTLRSAH